jgi:glycosyltransferase involved in cell wall biosynthesis
MNRKEKVQRITFLSDYPPRKCGIATFTNDLRAAIKSQYPNLDSIVISVNDKKRRYNYPPEVRFEIQEQDILSYKRAADFLNFSNTEVVSLQHEFGIFGGIAGSHLLALLRDLNMPVITTLHTVLENPDHDQMMVMKELDNYSSRLIVMSKTGKQFLIDVYGISKTKIDIIPQGIPDMHFVDPNYYKDQFGVEGKYVLLTFGLLLPNKGIENVLKALPGVLKLFPNVVYIVLGATHPNLVKREGESYRMSLERLAKDLGIEKNVIFYNRVVDIEELKEFLGAADIYITPYLNKAQITSGSLSYAFGCGKAVISTPYWHAEELLANNSGILVPFNDPDSITEQIIYLLSDESLRLSIRKKAYMMGREMVWNNVAHLYLDSFIKARETKTISQIKPLIMKTLDEQLQNLPKIKFDHLVRMTDSTGIMQHARYSIPNFTDGYCVDDNARALQLTILLEDTALQEYKIKPLMTTFAAFVNYSFNPERKRFRNFMSFNRKWLEKEGSEDSHGRALWALGVCVGRSNSKEIQSWATELFSDAVNTTIRFTSPRSWAFTLLGIHEYCKRLSGDRVVNEIRSSLEENLIELYNNSSKHDWKWFEDCLTYDNAILPHSLLASSQDSKNTLAYEIGLTSLKWLIKIQHSAAGNFRPIGNDGFYKKTSEPALYDQQPVEAASTISACLKTFEITNEKYFLDEARLAFEWFLGRNDLALPLYDPDSGGCKDGLQSDRVNKNMGAESTLSFLISLALMHQAESKLHLPEKNKEIKLNTKKAVDQLNLI